VGWELNRQTIRNLHKRCADWNKMDIRGLMQTTYTQQCARWTSNEWRRWTTGIRTPYNRTDSARGGLRLSMCDNWMGHTKMNVWLRGQLAWHRNGTTLHRKIRCNLLFAHQCDFCFSGNLSILFGSGTRWNVWHVRNSGHRKICGNRDNNGNGRRRDRTRDPRETAVTARVFKQEGTKKNRWNLKKGA